MGLRPMAPFWSICHFVLNLDVLPLFLIHPLIPIIAQDVSWIQCKSEHARDSSKPLRQTLTMFAAQGERNGAANSLNDSYEKEYVRVAGSVVAVPLVLCSDCVECQHRTPRIRHPHEREDPENTLFLQ